MVGAVPAAPAARSCSSPSVMPETVAGVRVGRLFDPGRSTAKIVALLRRRVDRAMASGALELMEYELTATERTVNYRTEAFLEFRASTWGGGGGVLDAKSGELRPEPAAALEVVYRLAQDYNRVEEQFITKGTFLRLRFNFHCAFDDDLLSAGKKPPPRAPPN